MQYIKTQNGATIAYSGPSLGLTAMTEAGWTRYEGSEPPERLKIEADGTVTVLPQETVQVVKKYSTLAIIRALGEQWETLRTQLDTSGYLDQFFAANYLASDDPVFIAFAETADADLLAILENCEWRAE